MPTRDEMAVAALGRVLGPGACRCTPDTPDAAHAIFCGQNGVRADRAALAETLPEASDAERADRADRGGAAVRVGGENTHTGRLLPVENAVSSKRALLFLRFGLQFCVCNAKHTHGRAQGAARNPQNTENPKRASVSARFHPLFCVCVCVCKCPLFFRLFQDVSWKRGVHAV